MNNKSIIDRKVTFEEIQRARNVAHRRTKLKRDKNGKKLFRKKQNEEIKKKKKIEDIFDTTMNANSDEMDSRKLASISIDQLYEDISDDERIVDEEIKEWSKEKMKSKLDELDDKLADLAEKRRKRGKKGKYTVIDASNDDDDMFGNLPDISFEKLQEAKDPFQFIATTTSVQQCKQKMLYPKVSTDETSALTTVYNQLYPMKLKTNPITTTIQDLCTQLEDKGSEKFFVEVFETNKLLLIHRVYRSMLVANVLESVSNNPIMFNDSLELYKLSRKFTWLNFAFIRIVKAK